MIDLAWDAPGPGVWELETTHASRPWSLFVQDLYVDAFARGFQQGTARYGLMLSHIQPAFVHGYFYMPAPSEHLQVHRPHPSRFCGRSPACIRRSALA